MEEAEKPRSRRRKYNVNRLDFNIYIHRALKAVHPDNDISRNGLQIINKIIINILEKLTKSAVDFIVGKRNTIKAREIQSSVQLNFTGDLGKKAQNYGVRAVTKYIQGGEGRKSRSERSGLMFSVSRVEYFMRNYAKGYRISAEAPPYMTAVIEYIASEILELAGNASIDNKLTRIKPRHIFLAIRHDDELTALLNKIDINILGGGVIQHINQSLLPKKRKTRPERD